MKTNLPIDELFRAGLQGYTEEAPMHVFDRIVDQRGYRKSKKTNPWVFLFLLAFILMTATLLYTFLQPAERHLDSFPVPLKLAEAENQATSPHDLPIARPIRVTPA